MGIINRTKAFNVVRAEMKERRQKTGNRPRWFKEDSRRAMEKANIDRNASRRGGDRTAGLLERSSRQVICEIMRD